MNSNNVHRHKENFQFLGNSYKDKNAPKKANKVSLEISSTEMSPSPYKLKSISHLKKDQLQNILNESGQFISPSRSHKDQIPNFLNDQIKYISPSHTSKNQIPILLNKKNQFISPTQTNKDPIQSLLTDQSPSDPPSFSPLDQKQDVLLIDQKTMTSPLPAQTNNNAQSYESKYKKARQKIKGMKIIIDVLNARVQKAVASKQEIEKQVLELKQQLDEKSQSQIMTNNSTLKSIAVSPKSQSQLPSGLESPSLMNSEIHDQRINNMFDKISRFEQTCDSAIQAFSEFQSFISSSSQINTSNLSNRSISLSNQSPNPNIQNKTAFSNTSTPINSQINASFEMIKKKNKQLQAKVNEDNETISQLNAKIRRRENENSMLKQQISDLQDSYNDVRRIYEAKQKKAQKYLYGLQQRYAEMQEEGNNSSPLSNKNTDILQILKENEDLKNRVKELSMKNSELVRIIYRMEKESKSDHSSLANPDSTNSPKQLPETKPTNNLLFDSPKQLQENKSENNSLFDSPKPLPDKVDLPMSVKYSFNQDTEEKSQDDSGVSCFIE